MSIDTPIRRTRVLLWPESCRTAGFVLGWRHWDGRCEQVCVVGTWELSRDGAAAPSRQLESLKDRIGRLFLCCCCSCEREALEHGSLCAGCTRKRLQGLDVVAYYDPSPSSDISPCGLPKISNTIRGCPFWVAGESFEEQQLVFFSDSGRKYGFQIFLMTELSVQSPSFQLLTRIEYAATIMDVLKSSHSIMEQNDVTGNVPPRRPQTRTEPHWPSPPRSRSHFRQHVRDANFKLPILALLHKAVQPPDGSSYSQQGHCQLCRKSTFLVLTHKQVALLEVFKYDLFLRCTTDVLAGLLVGRLLATLFVDDSWLHKAFNGQYSQLRGGMTWLNSFPIGFKLNQHLTATLSSHVCFLLKWHEKIVKAMVHIAQIGVHPLFIQASGALLGGSSLLALVIDTVKIGLSHILVLSSFFGCVYEIELSILHASWCLFRGKKRNILRKRTDTMKYDSTQLLFGTMLFVVAVFLFTTILVYHVFFMTIHVMMECLLVTFRVPYVFIHYFPFGQIAMRMSTDWFHDSFFLEPDIGRSNEMLDITSLKTDERCYSTIVWEGLSSHLWLVLARPIASVKSALSGPPFATVNCDDERRC